MANDKLESKEDGSADEAAGIAAGSVIAPLNPEELGPVTLNNIATQLLSILRDRDLDQRKHRGAFTKWLIGFIMVQFGLVSAVAVIVAKQGKFDGTSFVAFVAAFFGQVVAIALIVAKNLFPETNKDLAETLAAVLKK